MSRQEALRNELKALEWLRDRLSAQWSGSSVAVAGDGRRQEGQDTTRDLNKVNDAEYADPRKVFRN